MKLKSRKAQRYRDRMIKIIHEEGGLSSSEIYDILKSLNLKDLPKKNQIPMILVSSSLFFKNGNVRIHAGHYDVVRWDLSYEGKERFKELTN